MPVGAITRCAVLFCIVLNVERPRTSECKAFAISTFTTGHVGNVSSNLCKVFVKSFQFHPFFLLVT